MRNTIPSLLMLTTCSLVHDNVNFVSGIDISHHGSINDVSSFSNINQSGNCSGE